MKGTTLFFLIIHIFVMSMDAMEKEQQEATDIAIDNRTDQQVLAFGGTGDRIISIDQLFQDHLIAKEEWLDTNQEKELRSYLDLLSVEQYNEAFKKLGITKGKKSKSRDPLVKVLFEIVAQLKEQNRQLEEGGAQVDRAYELEVQRVKTSRKRYLLGTIAGGVGWVFALGQVALNIYLGSDDSKAAVGSFCNSTIV